MLGFNAAILAAQRYAEPGFVAAMIGGSPVFLALLVPAVRGRRPALFALVGACVVVAGVVVLSGGGSWHGPGLVLAALALAGRCRSPWPGRVWRGGWGWWRRVCWRAGSPPSWVRS
jgi:drug/metabolite transporter (DMT)-like permease